MDDTIRRISALERLLSAFPPPSQAEPKEVLKRYIEAVMVYSVGDLESAVGLFLTGSVPGCNPAFAPSAPELAVAVRRLRDGRLERELTQRAAIRQIEARAVAKDGTELSRAEEVSNALKRSRLHVEPEDVHARTAVEGAKHDAFFSIQDRSDDQIRRELKL